MTSATMDLITSNALKSVRSVERMTPHGKKLGIFSSVLIGVFSSLVSRVLHKFAVRTAEHTNQLSVCLLNIQRVDADDLRLLDPELLLWDKFESLKLSAREILKSAELIIELGDKYGGNLKAEARLFTEAIRETYEVANQLQWLIAEHDASRVQNLNSFVSENKAELEAMMDRIVAG